jgi:hypothetical protein
MSKKRVFYTDNNTNIFYAKGIRRKYFICGEKECRKDCEICIQIKRLN